VASFGHIDGAVVSLNISVTEDGKIGGASSGLKIARTVEPTEVAATAQQGAVTPGAQSDWRAAAETVVEGSEDWQMGNAGAAAAAAAAGGAAEDGPGAAAAEAESVTDGIPLGKRPTPANWGSMTKAQRESWKKHQRNSAKGKSGGAKGPSPGVFIQTLPLGHMQLVTGNGT